MKWLGLVIALLLVACGPSLAEVKTAKTARYTATPQQLMDVAISATEADYKIGEVDGEGARFTTEPQFYSAEGSRQSAGAGGYINMSVGSIMLSLFVEILTAEGGGTVVAITPKSFQMIAGSPKPRELAPDDPNLPGWVHGRVDALAVAIYKAAKQYRAP